MATLRGHHVFLLRNRYTGSADPATIAGPWLVMTHWLGRIPLDVLFIIAVYLDVPSLARLGMVRHSYPAVTPHYLTICTDRYYTKPED